MHWQPKEVAAHIVSAALARYVPPYRQAFEQRRNFTDLEATLSVVTSDNTTVECDAVISGSYFLLNEEENMVITVHDVTQAENKLKRSYG